MEPLFNFFVLSTVSGAVTGFCLRYLSYLSIVACAMIATLLVFSALMLVDFSMPRPEPIELAELMSYYAIASAPAFLGSILAAYLANKLKAKTP
ncbi:MAG: hypothetical protein ABJM58_01255 [Alteripontixanthobacter sp.]